MKYQLFYLAKSKLSSLNFSISLLLLLISLFNFSFSTEFSFKSTLMSSKPLSLSSNIFSNSLMVKSSFSKTPDSLASSISFSSKTFIFLLISNLFSFYFHVSNEKRFLIIPLSLRLCSSDTSMRFF